MPITTLGWNKRVINVYYSLSKFSPETGITFHTIKNDDIQKTKGK